MMHHFVSEIFTFLIQSGVFWDRGHCGIRSILQTCLENITQKRSPKYWPLWGGSTGHIYCTRFKRTWWIMQNGHCCFLVGSPNFPILKRDNTLDAFFFRLPDRQPLPPPPPPPPQPQPPPPPKVSDAELISSLICTWINGWVNTRDAGDCFIVGFTRFSVLDD